MRDFLIQIPSKVSNSRVYSPGISDQFPMAHPSHSLLIMRLMHFLKSPLCRRVGHIMSILMPLIDAGERREEGHTHYEVLHGLSPCRQVDRGGLHLCIRFDSCTDLERLSRSDSGSSRLHGCSEAGNHTPLSERGTYCGSQSCVSKESILLNMRALRGTRSSLLFFSLSPFPDPGALRCLFSRMDALIGMTGMRR
jgi:hypothetical protein